MPAPPDEKTPDPSEYEFLTLFFREVSAIPIVPGRTAYLPLTRRIERARALSALVGQNPVEVFNLWHTALREAESRVRQLTNRHTLPHIDTTALDTQIEAFLDQPETLFPPALREWVAALPQAARDDGGLAAWDWLWLRALAPPEKRATLPDATFSVAYIFHFDAVRQAAHDSRQRLTEGTLRYVISVASLYVGRGIPILELVNVGYAGLLRATERFTERGGAHFQHYASNWIRQRIDRYLVDNNGLIRLPVHTYEDSRDISRFVRRHTAHTGTVPTDQQVALGLGWVDENELYEPVPHAPEIAEEPDEADELEPDTAPEPDTDDAIETPITQVRHTRAAHKAIARVRLFRNVSNIVSLERSDGLAGLSDGRPALVDTIKHRLLHDAIERGFQKIHPRAAEILRMRYGLDGGQPSTLEEVGQRLGVTRERVRQIEAHALGKLRHTSVLHAWHDYQPNQNDPLPVLPSRTIRWRRARYQPPRQERGWVTDLMARYLERGRRGRDVTRPDTQRGRARLYAEVLREAGEPLPYREIHARAAQRYPELGDLSLSKIYSTLFYRNEFVSLRGKGGMFGLVEWSVAVSQAAHAERTLIPLLPPNAPPNRLIDSVMYGLDQLTRNPTMTAQAFLNAQTAYLRLSPPADSAAQAGFDVWAALGLIEPIRYPQDANTPLRLKTPHRVGEPLQIILRGLLAHFAADVLKTAEVLSAIERVGRANLDILNQWVFAGKAVGLANLLNVLSGLNALSSDQGTWSLTALGREVLGQLAVADLPEPPNPDDTPDEDEDLSDDLGLLDEI